MEFWLKVFRLLILAKNSIIWGDIQKENIPKHLGDVIRSIQDPYTFSYTFTVRATDTVFYNITVTWNEPFRVFAEDNIFYFGHLKLLSTFKKEFEKYKKETK
jgi:hypothetical protein